MNYYNVDMTNDTINRAKETLTNYPTEGTAVFEETALIVGCSYEYPNKSFLDEMNLTEEDISSCVDSDGNLNVSADALFNDFLSFLIIFCGN